MITKRSFLIGYNDYILRITYLSQCHLSRINWIIRFYSECDWREFCKQKNSVKDSSICKFYTNFISSSSLSQTYFIITTC